MGFWSLVLLAGFCFLGKATGKLKVKADPTLVKAAVGDDVLLECVFSFDGAPMDLSHLMIQWFRQGKQLAEFDNVVTVSRHGVNMSQEEVAKGNASLLLSRVGVENAGNYRCYITYSSEVHIREVTLQVVGPRLQKHFSACVRLQFLPSSVSPLLPLTTVCVLPEAVCFTLLRGRARTAQPRRSKVAEYCLSL
ncbi:V-set domain-containing T-cell activation inhibitor 1-like isoform X2 [Elgaria multicarinata webbii]|uniref:V-set domain-containing T-cell activation inhibitor 1-like isoform X2 n=1 Tax=Elgaria multicarinata webbii TaxID=159646 RepID=UPI002FCCEAD0